MQNAAQGIHVLDEIIVLGAGPRDADGVAFLECVIADQMGRHLTGDADDGDGIHPRIGEARDRIGGARARGDQDAADFAGRARIAFGSMHRALLMTDQDVLDPVLLEQLVIDGQHGAAGVAENMLHALINESLQHHFGACHCA